ncbi:unnamed protein product [Pedinophyceae sp. YPF-701]|nr:unnamed protein product [Pedinophyceae sp. YPF-701]
MDTSMQWKAMKLLGKHIKQPYFLRPSSKGSKGGETTGPLPGEDVAGHGGNDGIMYLAALYDVWAPGDAHVAGAGSEPMYTYTVLTTDSSEQLRWLHDRMPVLCQTPQARDLWLGDAVSPGPDIASALMNAAEDGRRQPLRFEWWPVTLQLNRIGAVDGPQCVQHCAPGGVKPSRRGNVLNMLLSESPARETAHATPRRHDTSEHVAAARPEQKDEMQPLESQPDAETQSPRPNLPRHPLLVLKDEEAREPSEAQAGVCAADKQDGAATEGEKKQSSAKKRDRQEEYMAVTWQLRRAAKKQEKKPRCAAQKRIDAFFTPK